MQARKVPFLFAHPEFFKLWLGQVTSQAGTRIYQIAIVWWILTISADHGGFALGAFMVAGALPALIFYKLIGRVVDRAPAKSMLVCCDLTSAALMAFVAWKLENNTLTLELAYLFGFLVALAEGFFNPALTKCLPTLVPEEALEQAVAYQASTQYLASFGGSVLGAMLISWLGIPLLVLVNAITYVFSALLEMTIRFADVPAEAGGEKGGEGESAEVDWQQFPLLRKLLGGFGLVNFFAIPVLVIIPLYVQKSLLGGPTMLGLLEASLWVGILFGTFIAAMIKSHGRNIRMGAICMSIFGLCMFASSFWVNSVVFAISLMIAGITLGVNNVKFVTLFQKAVPGPVKGQFFAAMQAIISFSFPIAYLLFGYLGDLIMPERVCLIQGTGLMIVAAWFYRLSSGESALMEYQNLFAESE